MNQYCNLYRTSSIDRAQAIIKAYKFDGDNLSQPSELHYSAAFAASPAPGLFHQQSHMKVT